MMINKGILDGFWYAQTSTSSMFKGHFVSLCVGNWNHPDSADKPIDIPITVGVSSGLMTKIPNGIFPNVAGFWKADLSSGAFLRCTKGCRDCLSVEFFSKGKDSPMGATKSLACMMHLLCGSSGCVPGWLVKDVEYVYWRRMEHSEFCTKCLVRVVRFYQSCSPPPLPPPPPHPPPPPRSPDPSGHSRTPTASSRSQWALPDLNRELQIPVGTAGPQPRLPGRSGHCRTSTATSRSQWALPDLNRDFQIAVGTAGPQPRLPDRSGHCRTSTGRMWEKVSDRMSEDMPDRMPERMSERMSEDMPDRMSEDMPERMSEDMSDRMSEDMPDRMPEKMSEDMPDRMSDRMPEDMPERMSEDLPDRMPEDMPEDTPEDMPDRMPEDISDRMPEDLPVRKCINVMVGITRSKVIFIISHVFTNTRYPVIYKEIWNVDNFLWMGKTSTRPSLSCFLSYISESLKPAVFWCNRKRICSEPSRFRSFWSSNSRARGMKLGDEVSVA